MIRRTRILFLIFVLALSVSACNTGPVETESAPEGETGEEMSEEIEPSPVPTDTPPPPTPTEVPPTETPVPPDPIVINSDVLADDGCPIVELNTTSWGPLYAAYNAGSDPFFHFHDNEEGFYFNAEFYTQYGAGWTGELGTFAPDCNANGICVYLVPDDVNPFWATAGEVTITALEQVDGTISRPVEIEMTNLTMNPVPGSSSEGCFHVDAVSILIEE